jgi:RNA polymerase sigma-70 factor (ECF subfamily)
VADDGDKIPECYEVEIASFFRVYSSWLFGHACTRTGRDWEVGASRELAEDLMQDTFEAAALQWATVRELGEAQQRAWLLTTLSRKDISLLRRRIAFRRKQPEVHHRYQPVPADTEREALSVIALERAEEVMGGLPGKQKRIALMKWGECMKNSEIAHELGCSEESVAVQVSHIRRKLIAGLGPYYPFAKDDKEGGTA